MLISKESGWHFNNVQGKVMFKVQSNTFTQNLWAWYLPNSVCECETHVANNIPGEESSKKNSLKPGF